MFLKQKELDEKYGQKDKILTYPTIKTRLYLHARAIQFTLNGKPYYFQADLDRQFKEALDQIRNV